jgi:hypothetical protein
MTPDHLLPATPARLASLPSGVQVCNADGDFLGRTLVDGVGHVYLSEDPDRLLTDVYLDLRDTLTRAAVAALVVSSTMGPHDSVRDAAGHDACAAAVWWPTWFGSVRITPEEITGHVARVARAALDALTPPEPPPPPPR